MHAALAQLNIPMLCFDLRSDDALWQQVVLPYARDCHAHAIICDYDPDPAVSVALSVPLLAVLCAPLCVSRCRPVLGALTLTSQYESTLAHFATTSPCPLIVIDSSYWTLRVPALAPASVQEHCAELMRAGTSWLMRPPVVGALDRGVQRALDSQLGGLFLPVSVGVTPLPVPPVAGDAVGAAVERFVTFSRAISAAAERQAEVR